MLEDVKCSTIRALCQLLKNREFKSSIDHGVKTPTLLCSKMESSAQRGGLDDICSPN
jgi:hypothetical protein